MIKITYFLSLLVLCLTVNKQLPPLLKTNFKDRQFPILNVTVGQKFSLPLPHFDTPWEKKSFKAFQISSEEFYKITTVESTANPSKQQTSSTEKQIGMDYLPFDCSLTEGRVWISDQVKSIREEYVRGKNIKWQQNQYIHLGFKSLLYILNVGSSQLTAYLYNDITLDKLTTFKLTQLIQRDQQTNQITTSPPVMAVNSQQDTIYIFTSLGVWQIKTKTILTNIRKIESVSGFNSAVVGGVDKILHGQSKMMIALKKLDSIYIIPEPVEVADNSSTFKGIKTFKGEKIFPQDIILISNTLYVLDFYKGIYVYSILNQAEIKQRNFIAFESFGGNFQFQIYQNTIFINFNDVDGSKVAQISFDLQTQQNYLVRYIKSDDFICSMQVFNVLTDYKNQPKNQKYSEDSFDSFLFMIQNYDDIEIYPFNIDPRMINHAYNAVKLKGSDIRKIFHIKTDKYLLITNQQIRYVRITIQKPAVQCRTKKAELSSVSKQFKLKLVNNISTCEHKDHSIASKRLFNEYCEIQTSYFIQIGDPEESQLQKYMLYAVVIGVVILFVGGLICLMQWRNSKMVILSRLKDQIMRFRNRHRKMQPFTQENVEQREIQIEVPQVHVTSEEQPE